MEYQIQELNPTAASLLGFLFRGPASGWDLARAVEDSIGYFWNVTRSQVYRELRALEAAGLVAAGTAGVRERRPYTLTAAGRQAFVAWINREPGPELIRFPLLLTVFFGQALPPERLRALLTVHRLRHEQRLTSYQRLYREIADEHPFPAETVRFGILYEEAVLRWLDTFGERPPDEE